MKWLMEFFQEDNEGFSSTRLALLLWALGVLAVWVYASIDQHVLAEIPQSVAVILGIVFAGKVTQKFAEQKVDKEGNPLS